MQPRFTSLVLLAVVLLFTGQAAAQTATFSIVVAGGSTVNIRGGASAPASATVYLLGDGFGCAMDTAFPVAVTAAGSRVTATVGTPALSFASGTGLFAGAATMGQLQGYNVSQAASITVQAAPGVASDFTDTVTITASFPGGDFGPPAGGCGPGPFPATEGSGAIQVHVTADASPPPTNGDGDGNGDGGGGGGGTGNETDGDEDGSPMGTWIVPLALLGAALIAARRRKQ